MVTDWMPVLSRKRCKILWMYQADIFSESIVETESMAGCSEQKQFAPKLTSEHGHPHRH